MKTVVALFLLLAFATPCHAAMCDDPQNAANAAINERNARVQDSHNVLLPDPEDTRGPLANCLGSIGSIGDAFTLGVKLPSMDQIVASMCSQVNSMIQSKINEVMNKAKNTISEIGGNSPFVVHGTGTDIVISVKNKLK